MRKKKLKMWSELSQVQNAEWAAYQVCLSGVSFPKYRMLWAAYQVCLSGQVMIHNVSNAVKKKYMFQHWLNSQIMRQWLDSQT